MRDRSNLVDQHRHNVPPQSSTNEAHHSGYVGHRIASALLDRKFSSLAITLEHGFQVQPVPETLSRLLQAQLERDGEAGTWWAKPTWNRRTRPASILDLRRLFWRYRGVFAVVGRPGGTRTNPLVPSPEQDLTGRAA